MYFCEIFRFKLGIIVWLLVLAVYLITHPIMPAESYQRPAQAHKCGDGRQYTGYSTNDVVSYKNGNYERKFTNVVLR